MHFKTLSPKQALNKAYQRQKPFRNEFNNFIENLIKLLNELNPKESEEHNKNYVAKFLEKSFYSHNLINTSGKIDLAVYLGKDAKSKVGVIGEVKAPSEKNDMPAKDNLNVKAMHQVILYYMRERIEEKNDDIKSIFITNGYEWFIFDAKLFEKLFYKNKELEERYKLWATDKKVSNNTDHFYKEIAADFLNNLDADIEFVHFDLRKYEKEIKTKTNDEKKLISLYKIFSKPFLLKEQFTNDSNSLDKAFYNELLYIIGLEEVKEGSKKLIRRKDEEKRDAGAIIENTIEKLKSKDTVTYFKDADKFGEDDEEKLFNIALQLNITWINRILFLKLLEAQLVNYNQGNTDYKFLDTKVITEYDDLDELFHDVLAKRSNEREKVRKVFKKIPYLNSSLFERSEFERNTLFISELKDHFKIPLHPSTVLKDEKDNRFKGELSTLNYLLKFLDAYDFSTESTGEEIQEEGKSLINASVLGLIFEKINGYKEGSFFTPGFITMYMSRETLRHAVVQKFNDTLKCNYKDFEELKVDIDRTKEGREKANDIINSIKVCDPAAGSGHFLVSVLNEIIAIKSELGVLCYRDGSRVQNYSVEIANDELIITDIETEGIFKYHLNQKGNVIDELQRMQEALFHEKQVIIENCLFGVDINTNSVNICRLRLWIELLKNSYYTKKTGYKELETLPNIDINIKQGNSLISRFELGDQVFTKGDRTSLELYKMNVKLYKNADDRDKRRELKDSIDRIRERIKGIYVDPLKDEKKKLRNMQGELDKLQSQISGFEDEKLEEKKEKLKKKIDKKAKEIVKQEEENDLIYRDAFEWRFEFPEVLDENGNFEGFDVVIGNPPYGRYLGMSEEVKKLLKRQEIYGSTGDIAEAFINRVIKNILKPNTQFSFIIPKGFSYVKSWKNIRQYFLEHLNIFSIIDTSQAFKEALYEMMIFHVSQEKPFSNKIKCGFLSEDNSEVFELERAKYSDRIFYLGFPVNYLSILNKVNSNSYTIVNDFDCWYGKGGMTPYTNQKGKGQKLLTGKEIEKYCFHEEIQSWYLEREYLDEEDNRLAKTEKVVAQDIVAHILNPKPHIKLTAAIDIEQRLCLNTVMCFASKSKSVSNKTLLAIINSKFMSFYYYYFVFNQAIRTMHFMPGYADHLPLPNKLSEYDRTMSEFVDQILTAKKENPEADTSALEREIDQLVYKLYGLTEEEIRIVEES